MKKKTNIFVAFLGFLMLFGFIFTVKAEESPEDRLMKTTCACQGALWVDGITCSAQLQGEIYDKMALYCWTYAKVGCFADMGMTVEDRQMCIKGYYDKASEKIKTELISKNGVDKETANKITEPCNGNLPCIQANITNLYNNPDYGKDVLSTVASTQGPITLSDLKSLSTTKNSAATSVTNGANQVGANGENLLNKQETPRVKVTFSADDEIKEGTKVTATAIPALFKDAPDVSKLYFTWFLKKVGCDLSDKDYPTGYCDGKYLSTDDKNTCDTALDRKREEEKSNQDRLDKCDLDKDGLVSTNDWKIAAARISVQRNLDKSSVDYFSPQQPFDDQIAGETATPSLGQWPKTKDQDNDNGESAEIPNCYVKEPKSGIIYELRNVQDQFSAKPCPDTYHPACVINKKAKCNVTDTTTTTSPRPTKEGSFDACEVNEETSDNTEAGAKHLYYCNRTDVASYEAQTKCQEQFGRDGVEAIPMCVKDPVNGEVSNTYYPSVANDPTNGNNPLMGIIFAKGVISDDSTQNTNGGVCKYLAKPNKTIGEASFLDETNKFYYPVDNGKTAVSENCEQVIDIMTNGLKDQYGSVIFLGSGTRQPECTFTREQNLCKHLFPRYPHKVNVPVTLYKKDVNQYVPATVNLQNENVGDGRFTFEEKKFWGANPAIDKTSDNMKDEAKIIGKGVDNVTWSYNPGDEIGVAVEGESELNTDHADSSKKIMWAFTNNKCEALEKLKETGFYVDVTNGGNKQGVLTANFDLDYCLPENLMKPDLGEAQQFLAPKVTLNAMPANPINDANGKGDTLQVSAVSSNMTNTFYKWQVLVSQNGSNNDETLWSDITQKLVENKSFTSNDLEGIDKSDLSILLNIPDLQSLPNLLRYRTPSGDFYLKIKATVTENNDANNTKTGETVVKVIEQKNKIEMYPVAADTDGKLKLVTSIDSINTELTGSQCDNEACYVTKSEIVGLKLPDGNNSLISQVSWKVNGNEVSCSSDISTDIECASPGGREVFFPVTGNIGEPIDVVVTAKSCPTNVMASTCQNIELKKHFKIIDPSSKISVVTPENTTAQAWPKVKGYFIGTDGQRTPDNSESTFETFNGNAVTFKAQTYPAADIQYDWYVDGNIADPNPDPQKQNEMELTVDKNVGESYIISVVPRQTTVDNNEQLNNIRKALYNNWGITLDDTASTNNDASIQLNIIEGQSTTASVKNKGFFASLVTHLPDQLMFLVKIILTSVVLLMTASMSFAFIPQSNYQERE